MVSIYTGTPGSGKSLHLARLIYELMNGKEERLIIANFEIDTSRFKHKERFMHIDYEFLMNTPSPLVSIAKHWFETTGIKIQEGKIYLLIDEAQLVFGSREWNKEGRREWLAFFTQHRKFGFNVVLSCQNDLMIDKQIRALIEYEYTHRKTTNFGFIGRLIKALTFGDLFVVIERWYGLNERIRVEHFRAKKKYYMLYDTYKDFGIFPEWKGGNYIEQKQE